MRKMNEPGILLLTKRREIETLAMGALANEQTARLAFQVVDAMTEPILVTHGRMLTKPCPNPEFGITLENHKEVKLALHETIALGGLQGMAARMTGKKRVARRILKGLNPRRWK